jgi:hypothetical protein
MARRYKRNLARNGHTRDKKSQTVLSAMAAESHRRAPWSHAGSTGHDWAMLRGSALWRWAGARNGKESGKEEDGGGMRCGRKMHVTMHGDELTRRAAVEMGSGVVGPKGRWEGSACVHNTLKHT